MSSLVRTLAMQIKAMGMPVPEFEFRFAAPRRWRFDICWLAPYWLAVEVEGGVWTRGRHSRGKGMVADMEKYNEATVRGWRVLRFANTHIVDGSAISFIERAGVCGKDCEHRRKAKKLGLCVYHVTP